MPFVKIAFRVFVAPSGTERLKQGLPRDLSSPVWTSQLSQPASLGKVLQPSEHLCGLLQPCSSRVMSFICWRLQTRMQNSRWAVRGTVLPLSLLPSLLWMQTRTQVAFWAAKSHCWVVSGMSWTHQHSLSPSPRDCSQSIFHPAWIYACYCPDSPALQWNAGVMHCCS